MSNTEEKIQSKEIEVEEDLAYRNMEGVWKYVVLILSLALSLFAMYTAAFGTIPAQIQRALHIALAFPLVFILYPARKGEMKLTAPTIVDIILVFAGIGQSTCVGIGGDIVPGSSFHEIIPLFEKDDQTKVVVLIGEIGGSGEEEAAERLQECSFSKPVLAFLAGRSAPEGKRMGHAGAIVSGRKGTYEGKAKFLEQKGIRVTRTFEELISAVREYAGV
jgi:hypothetical protein